MTVDTAAMRRAADLMRRNLGGSGDATIYLDSAADEIDKLRNESLPMRDHQMVDDATPTCVDTPLRTLRRRDMIDDRALRATVSKAMTESGWVGAEDFIASCADDELLALLASFVRASVSDASLETKRTRLLIEDASRLVHHFGGGNG